jgi:hypothetical protein
MNITLAYLRDRFATFNEECFGGGLPVPALKVGRARTMLGSLRYRKERRLLGRVRCKDFTLTVSSFYDLPQEEIDDTILHEMIHLYIASHNMKDDAPHGRLFRQKMAELNSRFGRHITVSHRGKLEKAEHGRSQNIIAVVQMQDGSIGVMRPSRTRIFEISRTLHIYNKVENVQWYFSRASFFDTLPRSLKPKVYHVDREKLAAALADAIPVKVEGGKVVAMKKAEGRQL